MLGYLAFFFRFNRILTAQILRFGSKGKKLNPVILGRVAKNKSCDLGPFGNAGHFQQTLWFHQRAESRKQCVATMMEINFSWCEKSIAQSIPYFDWWNERCKISRVLSFACFHSLKRKKRRDIHGLPWTAAVSLLYSFWVFYFTTFVVAVPLIIPGEVISRDCLDSRRTVTVVWLKRQGSFAQTVMTDFPLSVRSVVTTSSSDRTGSSVLSRLRMFNRWLWASGLVMRFPELFSKIRHPFKSIPRPSSSSLRRKSSRAQKELTGLV